MKFLALSLSLSGIISAAVRKDRFPPVIIASFMDAIVVVRPPQFVPPLIVRSVLQLLLPESEGIDGTLFNVKFLISNLSRLRFGQEPTHPRMHTKITKGPGLGNILDTISEDTEDTAHSCMLSVSKVHFHPPFINGICI